MNFNKRVSKSIGLALVGITVSTPILGAIHADSSINSNNIEQAKVTNIETPDISQVKNYYIENNIKFEESINNQGELELTITDEEIYKSAKEAGYNVDMSVLNTKANGANKIVWRNDGGFDLYVSKNTLLLAAGAGLGALTVLLAPFAPWAVGIISSAVGMYLGGNITDGRVFRFLKVKTGKYTYTYALQKTWIQK